MRRRRAFGTIKQRPPRPGFYVRFSWGGRCYERQGGPTRAIARGLLTRAEALLRAGEAIEVVLAELFGDAHGSRLTFRDAVPLYLAYAETRKKASTLAGDRTRLGMMMRAPWAGEFLTNLRPETLTRWATERAAAPKPTPEGRASIEDAPPRPRIRAVSGATVNRDLNLGSALFRWARSMGHVTENPFREVRRFSEKGRAREVYLTAPESRALVGAASPFLRPMVVAALSTGMRRGELLALRWRAVDLDRGELHVEPETEKAGRGRTVPLTALLRDELKALKGTRNVPALDGSDSVFRCADGAPLTIKVLRAAFGSAVETCEAIPNEKRGRVTFHTLRHTAASLMVAAGVPIFDVAKTLGHSTIAVTMRYSHFAPEAGRAAIERLGAALGVPGEDDSATRRTG
jgi:integrase